MKRFALMLFAAAACDNYNPVTSFGGDADTGDGEENLPILAPGEDVCWLIAQISELELVHSHGLSDKSPPAEFLLAPNGATASAVTMEASVQVYGLLTWSVSDAIVEPRPIHSPSVRFNNPEEGPDTEGSRVVVWTVADGPAEVSQKVPSNFPPPPRQWEMNPYVSVGGGYEVLVADLGFVDPFNFADHFSIDVFPPISKILGAVRSTRSDVAASPPGSTWYPKVQNGDIAWIPYGGVCYLGLPSGLDGGTGN